MYILRTHHKDYLIKNFTRFKFKTVTVTLAGNIIIPEELGGEEILYTMGVYVLKKKKKKRIFGMYKT